MKCRLRRVQTRRGARFIPKSAFQQKVKQLPENIDNISFSGPALSRLALIWCLFFLICFSLGYPTLNRYAPTTAATNLENPNGSLTDTKYYASLIENGFTETAESIWRYRVLVPYVAKPFYTLSKGHIGSWDPVFFGLLVANSFFIASAAIVLFLIGAAVTESRNVGFISSLLMLGHFNISNLYLAGLVDSSELFLTTSTIWLLLHKKWHALPFIAILAALSRETTVVFTAGLSAGWFIAGVVQSKYWRSEIYTIIMYGLIAVALGLGGLMLLRYVGTSAIVLPWKLQGGSNFSAVNIDSGIWGLMTSKALLYGFVWLLPLGLLGIKSIPRNWLWASALTSAGALFLIVMMNAGENSARPLFNILGPMLLVAAASFIDKFLNLERSP